MNCKRKLSINLGENFYEIIIGKNFFQEFSVYIKNVHKGKRIFVITDKNVDNIYGKYYDEMFDSFEYSVFVMEAGEKYKTLGTVEQIYNHMIEKNIKRNDLVVAFGGGVVGDVAGFVAATYLRGVKFVQIPTTIIAQVDSSVGGKVGVDMPQGKNMIGAFYQPKLVLIDEIFLNSLTDRHFFDGFGEIVKYGCIYDKRLFEKLENIVVEKNEENSPYPVREKLLENIGEIIDCCCKIKGDIVQRDEKESHLRMILNFGHTIGHGIEQYTNYEKYLHGECVSIGMVEIIKRGIKLKITEEKVLERVENLLRELKLPVSMEFPLEEIVEIIKRDKKSESDGINFIFLREIGKVEILKKEIKDIL